MILKVNKIEKKIRAEVIKDYLKAIGTNKCVCFTCGNCAKYLKKAGLDVIEVGENGLLSPNVWFNYYEIAHHFNLFDATSGHLPIPLMVDIALRLRVKVGKLKKGIKYIVACGSGETFICLKLAYPNIKFTPMYNVKGLEKETKYNSYAPLNRLVELLK